MVGGGKLNISQYFFLAVFWYACWFLDAIPYWQYAFLGEVGEQAPLMEGEGDDDSFISAAMFQDMG